MKIRILNSSIRFRITTEEMKHLANGKDISSVTHFLTDALLVQIRLTNSESHVDLVKNKLTLSMNKEKIVFLHDTETEVGIEFDQGELKVTFEKDFKCLTDRGEDESLLYANPRENH